MSSTSCSPVTDLSKVAEARSGSKWCLFLDRDGVINRRVVGDYVRTWRDFELLPSVEQALQVLSAWAPHVVVLTNQQGVGKGLMSPADLADIHARFVAACARADIRIDQVLHCPHLESDGCECRKPATGLATRWLQEHPDCAPDLSIMVGDAESDMEMATRLANVTGGCLAVKIGHPSAAADLTFATLADFAAAVQRTAREVER